jgi:hypothetical protein
MAEHICRQKASGVGGSFLEVGVYHQWICKGPLLEPQEQSSSASWAKMVKELARGKPPPTKAEEDHLSTLELLCLMPFPVFVWGPPELLATGSCYWVGWRLRSLNAAFPW